MAKKSPRHNENEGALAPARPKRSIIIRPAVPRDTTPLYDLLIKYFDELSLYYPAPVEAPTMAWGFSILVKGGVVVAEEDGELIGSVGVEIGNYPWNPKVQYLNAVWFYVAPDRRVGGTANRLIQAAKDFAIKNKMALRMDNVWGVAPEKQDRYREIHGFKYVGGNHVWFPGAAGE